MSLSGAMWISGEDGAVSFLFIENDFTDKVSRRDTYFHSAVPLNLSFKTFQLALIGRELDFAGNYAISIRKRCSRVTSGRRISRGQRERRAFDGAW